MERPMGVAGRAVVRDGDRVLLVRRAPGGSEAGRWELPGGKLEPGEELVAAVAREVLEETGLTVAVGRPFFTWQQVVGAYWVTGVAFVCEQGGGEVFLDAEHDDWEWVEPEGVADRLLATATVEQLQAYTALRDGGGG
jgi:8-oxo-dGTP diphosphatase